MISLGENFSLINKTKGKLPRLPFEIIKRKIIGEKYNLSVLIVGDTFSKKINNKYRGKNKPTNILSFPLDKENGEIFLNFNKIKKESERAKINLSKYFGFLFIHGLLHLKGFEHGSKMESEENRYKKEFGLDF